MKCQFENFAWANFIDFTPINQKSNLESYESYMYDMICTLYFICILHMFIDDTFRFSSVFPVLPISEGVLSTLNYSYMTHDKI